MRRRGQKSAPQRVLPGSIQVWQTRGEEPQSQENALMAWAYKSEERTAHQCFRLIFWTDSDYRSFVNAEKGSFG